MKKWFVRAAALLLCFAFFACPADGEGQVKIEGIDLTDLIDFPQENGIPQRTIEQPEFTGDIIWFYSYDNGGTFVRAPSSVFYLEPVYRAVVTLAAKSGYTFAGTAANSFTHHTAVAENQAGGGKTLDVTVSFPKTPRINDKVITATALTALVSPPYKNGIPPSHADMAEYSINIRWETQNGQVLTGTFEPGTVYYAVVTVTPKSGFTLSGLHADSFNHLGAQSVSFNMLNSTVTIRFKATAGQNELEIVSIYDLSDLIAAPVHRENPIASFENVQYNGTVAWSYADNAPIAGAFDFDKAVNAVVTLTAKPDFTFNGVPANAFAHAGATSTSNTAGSGTVTISFPASRWSVGTVTYPRLNGTAGYNAVVNICCWHGGDNGTSTTNSGSALINLTNPGGTTAPTGYWDYGYQNDANAATRNQSNWPDIMKTPLNNGEGFTGDENGRGHPSIFEAESMPSAIRKRAHAFTIDLGAVRDNIVKFGMYPRSGYANRFPIQFEVFYSDTEIGAIPDANATSLGVIEWPVMTVAEWRDLDLYPLTANGRGISARYIHVRIYAEGNNGIGSQWVATNLGQIRIGLCND